jgi:putative cardiolipin synthase
VSRPEASYAQPPATSGTLADIAQDITTKHGADRSGFHLLDGSLEGLQWRLALIDSATTSLDIQTYLWYPDHSGRLVLERAVHAANRGVKVRMIVDDLLLHGLDQMVVNLQAHPNIEFRIFNPWQDRESLLSRAGEMIARMERLNTRMHDKLLIADGRAAVIGGRNIGDHYFGISTTYNFHDTDLLGIGHIGLEANDMFDRFWNSEWVLPGDSLKTEPDAKQADIAWTRLQAQSEIAPELASFSRKPQNWQSELDALVPALRIGRSELVYDETDSDQIQQNVISSMFNFFKLAEQELLIMNAYIIPSQPAIDFMQSLTDRGVDIRILTNSLASHDVPAVNSHYEPWRDDFINAGVELFELRADPAIKAEMVDVPPADSAFTGLHSKTAVVDRRYVFVGSMNLDPRSAKINTEMGAFVDSPELAEDLAALIERNMLGINSWQVKLNEKGKPYWVNSDETVTTQPARDGMQRVMNEIFKVGPAEQY